MRQHRFGLSICVIGLLLAAFASPASAQVGRVGGVVRDESGEPLKGATVTADQPDTAQSFTATTDDKGRFTMIGLRTGRWRFAAQAPGYAPDAGELGVRVGAPNPPIAFMLKKNGPAAFGALAGIEGKNLQSEIAAADLLFEQSRWDNAIEAYRSILSKAPILAFVNLQIAAAYRGKKDYASALNTYNTLLAADPGNQKAQIGLAMTNIERGDTKAAEEILLKAAEGERAGREVFYSLGEVKFTQNEMDEAAKWFQKASTADPYWGKPLYKLGLCAIKQGDTTGATKLMAQVIAVDPVSPEAALAKSSLDSLKK